MATATQDGLDQAAHDTETDDDGQEQPLEPNADAGELFDRSQYDREDLAIPKVDGQQIDKIRVDFAGSVMLDRSDPADVSLYNKLVLGKNVELRCAGKVSGHGVGFTTNRDGNLDAVVGKKTVKVDDVYVLTAEEL